MFPELFTRAFHEITMDAATFFTFDSSSEMKAKVDKKAMVDEKDVDEFKLRIGNNDKTLFDGMSLATLKEAWSEISDWGITWNDLVFIYNFIVTMKKHIPQWSNIVRMKKTTRPSATRETAGKNKRKKKPPGSARDAIAITIISDSVISKFHKLKWTWANLDAYKPETALARKRTRKSPSKKTPIASMTIDDDDAPLAVSNEIKDKIATVLGIDALSPAVQGRVWEGVADWATIERVQVSAAARAVRVPLPQAPTPPLLAPQAAIRVRDALHETAVATLTRKLADKQGMLDTMNKATIPNLKRALEKAKAAPAPAPAPAAPDAMAVAVNAEVMKLRDQVAVASGQVTLLQQQQEAAKKDQTATMRASLVLEAEVKRLKGDLAAMATALAAAGGGESATKPPDANAAGANAGASAGADDVQPATKRQKTG